MQFEPKTLVKLRRELGPCLDFTLLKTAIQACNQNPDDIAPNAGLDDRLAAALVHFNTRNKIDTFLAAIASANPGAKEVIEQWRERLASASDTSPDPPADEETSEHETPSESILAGRINKILLSAMLLGTFSWFLARSPGTTGAIPAPIYAILFTPATLTILLGLALVENHSVADHHPQRRRVQTILASLTVALCWIVSLQYFIILAPTQPVDMCATRPNYDLLFRDIPLQQIKHCMSRAEAFNASAPWYLKYQYLQAWSHIALPSLATVFAFQIWRRQTGRNV